ncbi:ATP-dependent Clp protease ATP-binding subunit ClpX [Heyndrickxia sporothermodurans]|uniref:ATP-dependent Clp protease ATP-binding subunit ClpX n=1 Tax=Heyndrickxia sporothermodurans TaxID=46224 RepID=UPI000D3D9BF3|nr:ATP-dependent Clp protease ATP-binding subunit ClpX [Heyndrickxia sporothermodurans]PTY92979.1 ATP-dependent protease ATP-binding subunit ClpX [Heyndrickxia sporothermodurans]
MADTENKSTTVCSFCKQEPDLDAGRILIQGLDGAFICTECIEECQKVANQYKAKPKKNNAISGDVKPSKILEYLNQYVINQDYAKTVLSVAIYNHYKFLDYKQQDNPAVEMDKSNILLVGPTGSGKTYLIKTIAKMLDVPFAMADATNLTQAGYVGEDPENVVRLLVENANGDIEKAQRGIIYIDEIDKLSRKGENPSITRDVGGEGVQQALLKIIEGSTVEVAPKGSRKHPLAETIKVDTSNILFIVGGSFEGIDKIIEKRQKTNKSGMGFGATVESKTEKSINDYILDVKAEDLKKFGMLPEFIGRLPVIAPLQELSEEALMQILTEPKNALVKQYQELMRVDGVELEFTPQALTEIAKLAQKRKTGARSLRSIIEEVLLPHMFSVPDEEIEKLIITKETVVDKKEPIKEFKSKVEEA